MAYNYGIIVPMANESKDFDSFIYALINVLNKLGCGKVYIVVDKASMDNTLELCQNLSGKDERFYTIWAPENRNVVDAYLRGYREALINRHDLMIEMDAGLSHDPNVLPRILKELEDYDCAFGSRFIEGGSIFESNWKRTFLSRGGTIVTNILLGTKMDDMTSGYQGFRSDIVKKFVSYPFLSKAHFYQTELRYLLRKTRYVEIPIHYRAPSSSVSGRSILNSIAVLFHYIFLRLRFKSPEITSSY